MTDGARLESPAREGRYEFWTTASTRGRSRSRIASPSAAGVIVVAPGEADELTTAEQKTVLDALHLRKIDLADRVLIVNPGGYIGESTSREIAYAHCRQADLVHRSRLN